MRGFIYANPQLAYEGDGFYTFLGDHKPHEYWVVLREMDDVKGMEGMVLIAPMFFDVMDNLPESVIDSCPCQIDNVTIGIGRCLHRPKEDLTTAPAIYLNPDVAKQAYKILARSLRRARGDD